MKRISLLTLLALQQMFVCTLMYALDKQNGVYQIGTAEDLKAFAQIINSGDICACAVLTADIDKGSDNTMIGTGAYIQGVLNEFQGIFDGNGHTISINLSNYNSRGTAIFRNVGARAIIQNLKVQGTISTNQQLAAGIAIYSCGFIRNCYVNVTVNSSVVGDAMHGGIVAVSYSGTVIENCLAKFTILGASSQNCGGLVGWANYPVNIVNSLVISDGSSFDLSNNGSNNIACNTANVRAVDLENYNQDIYANRPDGACYNNYVTNQWGDNVATTVVSYDDLADGRICYQLNNDQSSINWVQEIGVDPFPVPAVFGSARVYASGATGCNGQSASTLTYSNNGSDNATKHTFDRYGICSDCGCFNFHGLEFSPEDNAYLLKNAADIDLAEGWNRVTVGLRVNLKMAADIEYVAEPGHYIFNTSNCVDGIFNGDGHNLTIEMTEMGNNASFFPEFSDVFENVIMHGMITTSGMFAGSITSHARNSRVKIRNVFCDIEINTTQIGDNLTGGLIGVADTKTTVDNVIYAGNINGTNNTEGLAGFCGCASDQTYFTNCAFIGTITGDNGNSQTLSRNPSNIICDNVFSTGSYGLNEDEGKYTLVEEEAVESGELAYYLNGMQSGVERFYQKIGVDLFPMPIKKEGALVYAIASKYRCDGTPISSGVYSNTPSSAGLILPHQFEEGFCTVCGNIQEDYLNPVDGWFEISNGAELLWWSHYAAKHHDASAKLTDNIDMDGYSERWALVGTEGAPFYGNFDGQFHTISNLVVNKPDSDGVGLIAVMNSLPSMGFGGISDADARASEGVCVKNVTLDETCSILGRGYVGVVGMTASWVGHVNIKGVMMCGDVTANGGPNAAGVLGCVMGSSCHVTIDNCGMVGNIYGSRENGSLSGWLGRYAEVTNCFAVGSVEWGQDESRYFARYASDDVKFTNCYARYGTQVSSVSEEDIACGKLTYMLNGDQSQINFYQTIGEDSYPTLNPSHGVVHAYYQQSDDTFYYSNECSCVSVEEQNIEAGNSALVQIVLKNFENNLVAFQMDLTLPEGVGIDKTGCSLSSRVTDEDQVLTIGKLADGKYRLTSTSLSLDPISGNDGTLLTLKLTAENGCVGGQATISNIRFSTSESEKIIMEDETFGINVMYKVIYMVDGEAYKTVNVAYNTQLIPETEPNKEGYTFSGWSELPETMPNHDVVVTGAFYLYGDVNVDEEVDVLDVVDIARFVVGSPAESFVEILADINKDSEVNLGDAVTLVNTIAGDQNFVKAWNAPSQTIANDAMCISESNGTLSLNLENERDYTAFQFDLYVPENSNISQMMLNAGRRQGHQLLYNKVEEGHYRVAALSTSNHTFNGNIGELLNLTLNGVSGEEVRLCNVSFFDAEGHCYLIEDVDGASPTSIRQIDNGELIIDNSIYDLQGRKLETLQRGVNIVGGKKIIRK